METVLATVLLLHEKLCSPWKLLCGVDGIYPGLRATLSTCGLSVQPQNRYPIRTPIDQRCEQTINCSVKTSGRITHFLSTSSSVHKWCLNMAEDATNIKALYEMTGLDESSSSYKLLRPAQITKSGEKVCKVMDVLENEYVNTFGINIDKTKLVNLSSGVPLKEEVADEILKAFQICQELAD